MVVKDVYNLLNDYAPYDTQAHYDNSGLNVGDANAEVKKILLTVDVSLEVLDEAIEKGCNLIVSHHPIIFGPIKNVVESNYVCEVVIKAIKNSINLLSCHTNMDLAVGGINDTLCSRLNGKNPRRIVEDAFPCIFDIEETDIVSFARFVSERLDDDRVCSIGSGNVKTVAVVGGAGGDYSLIDYCIENDIVLVTSEIKHHLARMIQDRHGKLITVGHFTSEKIFLSIVEKILDGKVELLESKQTTPFNSKQ